MLDFSIKKIELGGWSLKGYCWGVPLVI